MSLGADVWDVVETSYVNPVVLASRDDKLEFSFNANAMNPILKFHHHVFSGISCFRGSEVHQKYAEWVLVGCII